MKRAEYDITELIFGVEDVPMPAEVRRSALVALLGLDGLFRYENVSKQYDERYAPLWEAAKPSPILMLQYMQRKERVLAKWFEKIVYSAQK